jgi:hypothetical protein
MNVDMRRYAVGYQWLTMRSKFLCKCSILVYAMDSDRWNFIDE